MKTFRSKLWLFCVFTLLCTLDVHAAGYEGDVVDGKWHGKGTYTWRNGDRYEGDYVNGQQSGKGIFTWANGNRYEGDFVNGKRTGKGTYAWISGSRYEGDFVDGQLNGRGTYTWASGSRYEGDFVDGQLNGRGTYTWASGERYEGDFVSGQRTGRGTYTWPSGRTYEGNFVNGQMVGKGTQASANGKRPDGNLAFGKIAESGQSTSAATTDTQPARKQSAQIACKAAGESPSVALCKSIPPKPYASHYTPSSQSLLEGRPPLAPGDICYKRDADCSESVTRNDALNRRSRAEISQWEAKYGSLNEECSRRMKQRAEFENCQKQQGSSARVLTFQDGFDYADLRWVGAALEQGTKLPYARAVELCSSVVKGEIGWRLPSAKDFEAIFQTRQYDQMTRSSLGEVPAAWTSDAATSGPDGNSKHVVLWIGRKTFEPNYDVAKRYVICVKQADTPATAAGAGVKKIPDAKKESAAQPALEKHSVKRDNKSNGGDGNRIILTIPSTATEDAAKAKAAAEAEKEAKVDRRQELADAKKRADEEKARAERDARKKAEGRLMNTKSYADGLEAHQADTWCKRKVADIRNTFSTGRNRLISIGNCSCRPGGNGISFQKQYRCEFPYSYREFESVSR